MVKKSDLKLLAGRHRLDFFALSVALVAICLTGCAFSKDGGAQYFIEQGRKAMQEGHFKDAIEWFKRADIMADGRAGFEQMDASLWEAMAVCYWKENDYANAREAFKNAFVKWDHVGSMGAMNPSTCRVLDLWACVYIDEGNYNDALPLLQHALEYSLGKWTSQYGDLDKVPYRTEREAYVCDLMGKNTDGVYQSAIFDLLSLRTRTTDVSISAITDNDLRQIFGLWKVRLDKSAAPNTASFNETWIRAFGASSPSPFASSQPPLPGSFGTSGGITPGGSGIAPGSSNGSNPFQVSPSSGLAPSGGSSLIPNWNDKRFEKPGFSHSDLLK